MFSLPRPTGHDVMSAVWFIGSILFFNDQTTTAGTWFFLAGFLELFIRPVSRPVIRLTRNIHVRTASADSNTNDF